jgi:hypothetical protein
MFEVTGIRYTTAASSLRFEGGNESIVWLVAIPKGELNGDITGG